MTALVVAWVAGLLERRPLSAAGVIGGVAVTVSLLVALGIFVQTGAAAMAAHATRGLPIDWQVELVPGSSADTVLSEMRSAASIAKTATVAYAGSSGFEASAGGTIQVTGPGKVIGIEQSYEQDFPGNIRPLLGKPGILVAQQTAANLHVAPGDAVTIHRIGLSDESVTLDGVVDLPNADSIFQAIGTPPGAAPQAPPDNVLILPLARWHELFDPQAEARPDSVRIEIHAKLDRTHLPRDPEAAFIDASGKGRNFEARVAGSALLANNLAARLDAAREDAAYARVLFLFLGAPGAALAVLLTLAVARSGAGVRVRNQALLRVRGAPFRVLAGFAAAEALVFGICGSLLGLLMGALAAIFAGALPFISPQILLWVGISTGAGIVLALAGVLAPTLWSARMSVVAARAGFGEERRFLLDESYLDIVLLALAAITFWWTAASGYQIVLATEGVAAISIDYWAFLAPLLFWLGMALLSIRLSRLFLGRKFLLAILLRPISVGPFPLVIAALSRQPRRIAAGVALTSLASAFAISTAIFNATYQAQSRIDAELTNGADVTVTGTSSAPAGAALALLTAAPGVEWAEPMQHRFAYVGADLQDLYGINAATIGRAARLSDAYFANRNAKTTLDALRSTPDGVLVSDETVTDFQLQPGDLINLRLQSAADHQYHVVPFHFIGIVREFPTAPSDSFLVANAEYLARVTGDAGAEIVLMRAAGDPVAVHQRASAIVQAIPGVKVSDVSEARKLIGSSLTAVNLRGLTRLELGYAILLVAFAAGLILALGVVDRRRSFAIMWAIGAKPHQIRAFIRAEALVIFLGGAILGAITGSIVALMLVKLLTGVFDPPPDQLTVPWIYLTILFAAAAVSIALAIRVAERQTDQASAALLLREGG